MRGPLQDSQVNLYIRFARKLAPTFTKDSSEYLIKQYTLLRAEDKTGSRQAHRITVRQMESLIRLSEACAKAELSLQVNMKHVQLAVQLLKSSIVDVELDEDQEFELVGGELIEQEHIENNPNASENSIRLTYNQYKGYVREIIELIDQYQIENDDDPQQATIVENYLQKQVDFLKTEEEATRIAKILDHVIDYMIFKETVLVREEIMEGGHRSAGRGELQEARDQYQLPQAAVSLL